MGRHHEGAGRSFHGMLGGPTFDVWTNVLMGRPVLGAIAGRAALGRTEEGSALAERILAAIGTAFPGVAGSFKVRHNTRA